MYHPPLEATFFYLENPLVLFPKEILHQCSTSLLKEWTARESGLHVCALSSITFNSVMFNTA